MNPINRQYRVLSRAIATGEPVVQEAAASDVLGLSIRGTTGIERQPTSHNGQDFDNGDRE